MDEDLILEETLDDLFRIGSENLRIRIRKKDVHDGCEYEESGDVREKVWFLPFLFFPLQMHLLVFMNR